MESRSIMMDKNYFIFLIKDILERFKSYDKQVNKSNILTSWVDIPTLDLYYGLEYISFKKQEDKTHISSKVLVCLNETNYSKVDYIFFNKEKEIIGFYPQIKNEKIRETLIVNMNEYYNNPQIDSSYFELTNWEIIFSNTPDTNNVDMLIINTDLSSVGINKDSFIKFIHNSISDKIITKE